MTTQHLTGGESNLLAEYKANLDSVSVPSGATKVQVADLRFYVPRDLSHIKVSGSMYMKGPNEPMIWADLQPVSKTADVNGARYDHWDSGTSLYQRFSALFRDVDKQADGSGNLIEQTLKIQLNNLATTATVSGNVTVGLYAPPDDLNFKNIKLYSPGRGFINQFFTFFNDGVDNPSVFGNVPGRDQFGKITEISLYLQNLTENLTIQNYYTDTTFQQYTVATPLGSKEVIFPFLDDRVLDHIQVFDSTHDATWTPS